MHDDYSDIKEFRIRSTTGQWRFSHFENGDKRQPVFQTDGRVRLRIIGEDQVRRLMAGETVDCWFSDMRAATGDWWVRDKRLREAAIVQLMHNLRTSTHPILTPLVEQLSAALMEVLENANDPHLLLQYKNNSRRLNETMTMLMGEWACPLATTEWLLNSGTLNNMNKNWRLAFGKVFGVKVAPSASNKAHVAAFEPKRQELLAKLKEAEAQSANL